MRPSRRSGKRYSCAEYVILRFGEVTVSDDELAAVTTARTDYAEAVIYAEEDYAEAVIYGFHGRAQHWRIDDQ